MSTRFVQARRILLSDTSCMEWMAEQGRRLKAAREAKGLTVEQLADLSDGGLKASRISNYEQGTRGMKPPQAKELAKLLDVSPAYLLTLTDDAEVRQTEHVPAHAASSSDCSARITRCLPGKYSHSKACG